MIDADKIETRQHDGASSSFDLIRWKIKRINPKDSSGTIAKILKAPPSYIDLCVIVEPLFAQSGGR